MSSSIDIRNVDISDQNGFWTWPLSDRAAVFDALRALDRAPFFPEPRTGLVPTGPGFYAVTSFDDVVTASRYPEVFRSGQGANGCRRHARLEIGVMFRELLTRIPDLRVSGEPRRLRSMFINGLKRLPCTFTPGPRATRP